MGMQIGAFSAKGNTTLITLKNRDGSTAGTISITKPNRSKAKKKRLSYSFKRVSNKIMSSKTSSHANRAVREARGTLVQLLMKQKSGDYDETEVRHAIEHARSIERVAKKHRKHIEEEERAKRGGGCFEEEEIDVAEEEKEKEEEQQQKITEAAEASAQELEELSKELERLMQESMEELSDLADELMSASWEKMDDDDVENMKRRHRAEELRDILEADMKYLKALFDRLAKEKQANTSGSSATRAASDAANQAGVSLEIFGVDMPVETSEAPVAAEGGVVDITV